MEGSPPAMMEGAEPLSRADEIEEIGSDEKVLNGQLCGRQGHQAHCPDCTPCP